MRTRRSFKRSIAVGTIAALVLASCGANDEDSEGTEPSPTAAPSDSTPSTSASGSTATSDTAAASTVPSGGAELQAWYDEVRAAHDGETVTMLMASHPGTAAFQEIVDEFTANTGVKVEFDVVEEGAMIEKQIAECGVQSDIYDIYMVAAEGVTRMAQTECAAPIEGLDGLGDWYDYEDLEPAYRDLFDVNGTMYGVPFAGESVFLMYRKDLFEEYGKEVPATWDELLETAKWFSENVDGVDGVSFRARQGWEFTYQYSVFLFPFGGQIVDPATAADCPTGQPSGCPPAIDVPGSVAALEYMTALKDYAPTGIESFSFPEAWQAFQTGKAAMLVEATAAASEIEDPSKSTVAGNVGYATLPEGPAGAFTGVWGWGLGLNNHSGNKEAAQAVIEWLTSRAASPSYVDAGGVPSRVSDFADPENQATYPYYGAIGDALAQAADLAATGNSVVPQSRAWVAWSDAIGTTGSLAFTGQLDAAEAVTKMQADMEAALEG